MSNSMKSAQAVVIAAPSTGGSGIDLSQFSGHKSLVPVNGRAAVSHVIESLKSCKAIDRVVLATDDEWPVGSFGEDEQFRAPGAFQAALAGLQAAASAGWCVFATGDLALASASAWEDLILHAPDADVVYPVVEQSVMDAAYPGLETYYLSAAEGSFTGSSCLLVRPKTALENREALLRLLEARSNPRALLGLLGAGFALRMMFSTLSVRDLEQTVSNALGLSCRVYESPRPELFVSIDSPELLALIERELARVELN